MEDNNINYRDDKLEPANETGDRQHVNPDGETDALKGARMAGIGSTIAGGVAGSVLGPAGTLAGAVIGAVAGTLAGGVAVGAIDKIDGDSYTDHPHDAINTHLPNPETGGYAFERPLTAIDTEDPTEYKDYDLPDQPEHQREMQPLTPYYNVYSEPQGNNNEDKSDTRKS
ncbi:MAG: hypothetical protein QM758_01320 [Armatimonas sp.]